MNEKTNKMGNLEMRKDEIFIANRSGKKPKTTKNQHRNGEFTHTKKLKHPLSPLFFLFPQMGFYKTNTKSKM